MLHCLSGRAPAASPIAWFTAGHVSQCHEGSSLANTYAVSQLSAATQRSSVSALNAAASRRAVSGRRQQTAMSRTRRRRTPASTASATAPPFMFLD